MTRAWRKFRTLRGSRALELGRIEVVSVEFRSVRERELGFGFAIAQKRDRISKGFRVLGGQRHQVAGQVPVGRLVRGLAEMQIPSRDVSIQLNVFDAAGEFSESVSRQIGMREPRLQSFPRGRIDGVAHLRQHLAIAPQTVAGGLSDRQQGHAADQARGVVASRAIDGRGVRLGFLLRGKFPSESGVDGSFNLFNGFQSIFMGLPLRASPRASLLSGNLGDLHVHRLDVARDVELLQERVFLGDLLRDDGEISALLAADAASRGEARRPGRLRVGLHFLERVDPRRRPDGRKSNFQRLGGPGSSSSSQARSRRQLRLPCARCELSPRLMRALCS